MNNTTKMLKKANAECGRNFQLSVSQVGEVFTASIVEADDEGNVGEFPEVLTLEFDWDVQLVATGESQFEAIAKLDAICGRDFS